MGLIIAFVIFHPLHFLTRVLFVGVLGSLELTTILVMSHSAQWRARSATKAVAVARKAKKDATAD